MRKTGSRAAVAATTIIIASASTHHTSLQAQERTWLPPPIEDTVFVDHDGLLGLPSGLRPSPRGGFVLYDWSTFSFSEFSSDGSLLWTSGRPGAGPGEFQRPLDYEFDDSGNLVVVDVENQRLTILDSMGVLVDTERMPQASQILPLGFSEGGWAVMPEHGLTDTLWVCRGGACPAGAFVAQPEGIDFSADIVGPSFAANLANGEAVIAYMWSDALVWLNSAGVVHSVTRGIEQLPFPEAVDMSGDFTMADGTTVSYRFKKPDPAASWATAFQPAVDNTRLFVLFYGATDDARRILDVYGIRNGEYLGSYLLPHAVTGFTILADGRLATLETEMIPTVRLWQLR